MISLVLPFYERREATDRALMLMGETYPELDLEVMIVDDGSDAPYRAPRKLPWPVNVVHLAQKSVPKNPCVPTNIGVYFSNGNMVALSSPEILHTMPVLSRMRSEIVASGPNTYVTAACWCPEQKRWHAHSTRRPLCADKTDFVMPEGAQYHFMAMMTRELFEEVRGFDREYRDGAGYDDNDFLMKLQRAGAYFVQRDDLVVEHPKTGAKSAWTPQMFERNRKLFLSKWRTH
jgi:hypothetical protein